MDLTGICKHRRFIMGCSIIWVLLVHATLDGGGYGLPNIFVRLCGYGSWGVDIFLFMSGVGWYFSYKNNGKERKTFWINRYSSLLSSYIPLAVIHYAILLWGGVPLGKCLLSFFTLSYWLEHGSLWYIALLLPLYLLFPLWRDWVEQESNSKYHKPIKICISIVALIIISSIFDKIEHPVLRNVSGAICKLPNLIIGYWLGDDLYHKKKTSPKIMVLAILIPIVIRCAVSFVVYPWISIGFIFGLILGLFANFVNEYISFIYRSISNVGLLTLELYITHSYVRESFSIFGIKDSIVSSFLLYGSNMYCIIWLIISFAYSLLFFYLFKKRLQRQQWKCRKN